MRTFDPRLGLASIAVCALLGCQLSWAKDGQAVSPSPPGDESAKTADEPGAPFGNALRKLEQADRADPEVAEQQYREARTLLDEEMQTLRASKADLPGTRAAHSRLGTWASTGLIAALRAQGRGVEGLAVLKRHGLDCVVAPAHKKDACVAEWEGLAQEFPCAVKGNALRSIGDALVIDDETSKETMNMIQRWAAPCKGMVLQRMIVTEKKSAKGGGVELKTIGKNSQWSGETCRDGGKVRLKVAELTGDGQLRVGDPEEFDVKRCTKDTSTFIGVTFKVSVPADDAEPIKAEQGEIVWVAMSPKSIKRVNEKLWDGGQGRVIAVEPFER